MNNQRVDGYHAHVYYDAKSRPAAEKLAETVLQKFHAQIGGFFDDPVGPHPVANLQIIFAPADFANLVPWLMLNRTGLNVLIHPLTDDSVRDHEADGAWLGTPVPLKLHVLSRDYSPDLLPTG
ncbi:MAG: DOPA 4,5-dioxygenase family protein [Stellaceae bacterium]